MGIVDGKVALITGAGRGLGAGIARAMAQEGAILALSALALEDLEDVAGELRARGAVIETWACDVSDRAQVESFVNGAADVFGGIDILINNASHTEFPRTSVEDIPIAQVQRHLDVDVMGTLHSMQAVFPHLKARGGGAIVNFGSNAASFGYPGETGYAIAKEGVRGLSRIAAVEWGKYGITVNVISPIAKTKGLSEAMEADPEFAASLIKAVPPAASVTRRPMSARPWSPWSART